MLSFLWSVYPFGLGAIGAIGAWIATSFYGGPIRRFFDLRGELERARIAAMLTPIPMKSFLGVDINTMDPAFPAFEQVRQELRKAGIDMLAFGQAEPAARLLRWFGYDAVEIGNGALALGNFLGEGIHPRRERDAALRKALRIK